MLGVAQLEALRGDHETERHRVIAYHVDALVILDDVPVAEKQLSSFFPCLIFYPFCIRIVICDAVSRLKMGRKHFFSS